MMIMTRMTMIKDEEMSARGVDDEDWVDWNQCQEDPPNTDSQEEDNCADNLSGKQRDPNCI